MSEEKEAKNQNEEEQKVESNDSEDLNSLTYEELLEQVEKQKEETLRAVAELENFRKRSTNEISNALKYANSELFCFQSFHSLLHLRNRLKILRTQKKLTKKAFC